MQYFYFARERGIERSDRVFCLLHTKMNNLKDKKNKKGDGAVMRFYYWEPKT